MAATPEDPFCRVPGAEWLYADFDEWAETLAAGLLEAGVGSGERVAILLPSSAQMLRILLALMKTGAVAVPIIVDSTDEDVSYVLDNCEARWLITDVAGIATVDRIRARHPALERIFVLGEVDGEAVALEDLVQVGGRVPMPTLGPHDLLTIMYTSGSTDRPKGVKLPQAAFGTTGRAIAERLSYTSEDVILCPLPLFHAAATLMSWAPATTVGAPLAVMPRFSASRFWEQADAMGATATIVVPTIPAMLLAQNPSADDRAHSLRLLVTHRKMPAFSERFGVEVCTVWGMTETSAMGVMTRPGFHPNDDRLVGWPYPDDAEVRVTETDGNVLGPNAVGELWFRHRDVMLGYLGDDDATRETLVDGWVSSGDLAKIDQDGLVYFLGRVKNMIKRSGENIAGEEVERALEAHDEVVEVAVLAVPDEIRDEEVYAYVVARPGGDLTADELLGWCRERLAHWKVPRYLHLTQTPLPRLANEKIARHRLLALVDLEQARDCG